jgi:predicted RNA-binding protein with PIN domain
VIIVDGNNMLFVEERIRRRSIRGEYQGARALLAEGIREYAEATRQPVTLTFDGVARSGEPAGRVSTYMQIVFSGPIIADRLIINMLDQGLDPEGIVVVSSDREVKHVCREMGAKIVTSGRFSRMVRDREPILPPFAPDSLDRRFAALTRNLR